MVLAVLDTLEVGMAVCDETYRVVMADEPYARILGRPLAQVIGVGMADVTHPDDLACNAWMLAQAQKSGVGFTLRKRYIQPDGSQARWVEQRVVRLSGSPAATWAVASRPCAPPQPATIDAWRREYVADMISQLAEMANGFEGGDAGQLMALAAAALRLEA